MNPPREHSEGDGVLASPLIFRVHGLRFASDIVLPPFEMHERFACDTGQPGAASVDVTIRAGAVPAALEGAHSVHGLWQAGDTDALLTVDAVGRIRVTDGARITYARAAASEPRDLAALLWGSVIPVLLAQRGVICLRGTALADVRGALLLVGEPGAGKTVVARQLMDGGMWLVSDGVVALEQDADGAWKVLPGLPAMRVWPLGMAEGSLCAASVAPLREGLACGWLPSEGTGDAVVLREGVRLVAETGSRTGRVASPQGFAAYEALAESALPLGGASSAHAARLLHALTGVARTVRVRVVERVERDVEATLRLLADPSPPEPARHERPIARVASARPEPSLARSGYFWLVSYPKSGNTWMRALLSAVIQGDGAPDINRLLGGSSLKSRLAIDAWSGLESAVLTLDELARLRCAHVRALPLPPPSQRFVKLHDALAAAADGSLLFPPSVTAGVVYIVRNPLDVAVSYAHHRGRDLDDAIAAMADPEHTLASQRRALHPQLPQHLSTWSGHVASWLDSGLPVLQVRYEDLLEDAAGELRRVLDFAGVSVEPARVAAAAEHARFDRLQAQERAGGFREGSMAADAFFREGRAGAWRERLTAAQVQRVVTDHGPMMERLGYLPLRV